LCIRQAPFRPGSTAWCTNSLTALLGIRTRYPNERHNFFGDRISAPKRAAVQGTHQRIVPISRPFFGSTKSATLQFCSVALSFKWVSFSRMNSARREKFFGIVS